MSRTRGLAEEQPEAGQRWDEMTGDAQELLDGVGEEFRGGFFDMKLPDIRMTLQPKLWELKDD